MPEETINDKTGDCEDQALLLASMWKNYNQGKYSVWLITISSKTPEPTGHVAVVFPVAGDELTILDPAGHYYTGLKLGWLRSESESVAISNWLSHWAKNMPGAIVNGVFSENFDEEFKSTEEFLTWLKQR